MKQKKALSNNLGVSGWLWAGRYQAERYLYFLHRLTGLGLILFIIIHLLITIVFRIQGQEIWENWMRLLHNPLFKIGESLVVIAFIYHALNGLRLILQELGLALGKPIRPIYPYQDSLRKKRWMTTIFLTLIVIAAIVFLLDSFIGGF